MTLDVLGRQLTVDASDTVLSSNAGGATSANVTSTSYYPTGSIKAQWGAQTNAAFYLYDEQNRMIGLRTYRSLAIGTEPVLATTGFDATTWLYDPARGWLTGKRDAANLGANYTYTPAGRLRTRQWARGAWTRYGYYATSGVQNRSRYFTAATSAAAVLAATAGNDPNTPDTGFTYDSLGRLDTANAFPGSTPSVILTSNKFYYTANFTLDKEDITVDPDGSGPIPALLRTLDRKEDALRRSTGWDLLNSSTPEHGNAYTYRSSDGRFDTVTGPGTTGTFTYDYTPNAYGLTATVTGPAHTVTNTWLSDREALDLKENKVGAANISTYDYSVNALTQRGAVLTSGSAFSAASLGTTAWGYDALGQVASADHPTASRDFGYSYDFMGNRHRSSLNTPNPATATAGNLGLYRSGPVSNSPEGGNNLNQHSLLQLYGASPQANTYDSDGNQLLGQLPRTSDAGARTWDGENRLLSAGTVQGYTLTAYLQYDAFHRRVAKRSIQTFPQGSSTNTRVTLYDGWNLIADYESTATTHTLKSSYTWGKDLSNTLQ